MANQTDICTCGHARAAHFEASNQACMRGDCICAQFDKVDPLRQNAKTLYDAADQMLSALSDYFLDCGLDLLAERLRRHAAVSTETKADVIEAMKKAADNLAEVMRQCR